MAETYKLFTSDDIIVGETSTVSSTIWSNGSTTYSPSAGTPNGYYAPYVLGGVVQYTVAYGDYNGYGASDTTDQANGTINTATKAIYSQYASVLLGNGQSKFTINGSSVNSFWAISFNRARMKQKIDPGNWSIAYGGQTYKDNSGAETNPSVNAGGRVFNIYQWDNTNNQPANTTVVGLFYPDYGVIILKTGTPFANAAATTRTDQDMEDNLAITSFTARSEERITSNYYFCRVTNRQFNYSTNPTFISGSGELFWPVMVNDPQVYITTVGLYNNANELLAVAKLSKPLLKNFYREALIKVKIDY